jgi:hypothetical protein
MSVLVLREDPANTFVIIVIIPIDIERTDKTKENLLPIISILNANIGYAPIFQHVLKKAYGSLYRT